MTAAIAQAHDAADVARADDLLAKLGDMESEARRLGQKAEQAKDLRTALHAVREVVRITELMAKLAGELNDGPVHISVDARQWAVALRVLDTHPDVKALVVRALEGAE